LPYLLFGKELFKEQPSGMVGGDVVLAFKPAGDEIWELVLASTALEGGSAS
jgi:hypothetical protein